MKEYFYLPRTILFIFIFASLPLAKASVIGGYHSFINEGGERTSVDYSGLEWLTLDHTSNKSRNFVESDMLSSGNIFEDWRYATRTETERLLDSVWPRISEGYHESNKPSANALLEQFGALNSHTTSSGVEHKETWFWFGEDGSCDTDSNRTCKGGFATEEDNGWFSDGAGLSTGITPDNINYHRPKSDSSSMYGSMLVRDREISASADINISGSFIDIFRNENTPDP